MSIEKINGFWVPSNDIHLEQWKVKGIPFMQDRCLKKFIKYLQEQNKKFNTVLDVGAWCGTWSHAMQKYSTKIIAFEPNAIHFDCLQKNLNEFTNITCNNNAIGDKNGMVSLTTEDATQNTRIEKESGNISMFTIDSFNYNDIDLIKIDVEGYEMKVLEGATETLKTVKFLMVELNSNTKRYGSSNAKVEKHIRSLGFKMLIKIWPDIVFYKV